MMSLCSAKQFSVEGNCIGSFFPEEGSKYNCILLLVSFTVLKAAIDSSECLHRAAVISIQSGYSDFS